MFRFKSANLLIIWLLLKLLTLLNKLNFSFLLDEKRAYPGVFEKAIIHIPIDLSR
jgi:hypothetical protein